MINCGKKMKKKESARVSPNQEFCNETKPKPKKSIAFSDVIDVLSPIDTSDCIKNPPTQRHSECHSREAFLPRSTLPKPQKLRASQSQRIVPPPPILSSRACNHNNGPYVKQVNRCFSEDLCSCACHHCSCCSNNYNAGHDHYHRSPFFRGTQFSDLDLYGIDNEAMTTLRGAIDDIMSNRVVNKLLGNWNGDPVFPRSRSVNMSTERKMWCSNRDRRPAPQSQAAYPQPDCLQNIYSCLNDIRQTLRKSRGRD